MRRKVFSFQQTKNHIKVIYLKLVVEKKKNLHHFFFGGGMPILKKNKRHPTVVFNFFVKNSETYFLQENISLEFLITEKRGF